jgi:ADP-ribose pyrophosphatase YjhB (NUDIX family)
LVRRATDPFKHYWDLPGGFVEVNESVEESIVRETKEETGIDLDPKSLKLFMTTWDRYLYKGIKDYTLGLIYSGKLNKSDKPIPADDVSEAKFFSYDQIPWEEIAFDSIRMILKRYFSESN